MGYKKYTNDDIVHHAKLVTSMAQLLKALGLKSAGGNYANMRRRIQLLGLSTDHWTGMLWNKDKQLKDWSKYTVAVSAKKHLINLRGHICDNCKNTQWFDRPITLEIHHIDGNRTNNELENLQLLCPNCHSYTDTWRNRKN